jgi:hypothetical protein
MAPDADTPRELFKLPDDVFIGGFFSFYDVTPDGQRFLMVQQDPFELRPIERENEAPMRRLARGLRVHACMTPLRPHPVAWLLRALFVTLAAAAVAGAQPPPAGPEFDMSSTYVPLAPPGTAFDANGEFVAAWQAVTFPYDGFVYVVARRFNAQGVPFGPEFQVGKVSATSYNTGVASDTNGNFVVVWPATDGDSAGVRARRYDAAGTALGGEFQVNAYTTGSQDWPAVAADKDGNFVAVWLDTVRNGIFGRRFDAGGSALTGDFRVDSYTTAAKQTPAIAMDPAGDFAVVWPSAGQDGDAGGIFAQRFDPSANPQGGEFPVNSATTGDQFDPQVAADGTGRFLVTWSTRETALVSGQRFDSDGTPLGSEFPVNTYTQVGLPYARLATDRSGNVVVTWQNGGDHDGSGVGVFGRRYDASGAPVGGEFAVNVSTAGQQVRPTVASDAKGDFVVTWGAYLSLGVPVNMRGRVFGDLIFRDDFESGQLARWSSASTDGDDLAVSPAGPMAGTTFGLRATVNDTARLYLQDDSPDAESRYRARFYLDPGAFDPGEAASHFRTRVFLAFDGASRRQVALVLKRQGGSYSMAGRVRLDGGGRVDTGFHPLAAGPHFVELDWARGSSPGVADGRLELRVDDAVVSILTGLDNGGAAIESARMGALSVKPGASGALYFDQFESRRQSHIGPE